ncbi:MAG: hypothetical protein ACXWLH_01145 [Candidatus Saccharimonadales bacterium]
MDIILKKLIKKFPDWEFVAGNRFSWSPAKRQIIYNQSANETDVVAIWSLLHELGHARLGHKDFSSDFELLRLEAAAWTEAEQLAAEFHQSIDQDHIQDCLDTYRDWLYQRSTCPNCTSTSLQTSRSHYNCFNCGTVWRVSASRLCRAYRRTAAEKAVI